MAQKYEKTIALKADNEGVISYHVNQNTGPFKVTLKRLSLELPEAGEGAYPFSCTINGEPFVTGTLEQGKKLEHSDDFKARGVIDISLRGEGFVPGETKQFRVEVAFEIGLF